MPGVLGASMKFIEFMASNISGCFIGDLSNQPSVILMINLHAHPCVNLYHNVQLTIINVALVKT